VIASGDVGATEPLTDFAVSLAVGTGVGVVAGVILAYMLSSHRVGIWSESPAVAILAVVALTYFGTEELGGSAYLAAFLMGLIVGNSETFGIRRDSDHARQLESFVTQVSELAVLTVFVTLGINLPLDALWDNLWGGLVVMAVFLLVARPLTVAASLLPDRRGRWTRQEVVFISWCRETGVVPAAIAGVLLAREVEGAELLAALVALAVVTTLLVQATSAEWLARRLGLVEEPEYVGGPAGS
jgi:cell volume regulation protein A